MVFEFEFGKITYAAGAPKNAPRWIWRCKCGCGLLAGPFRTLRETEADAEAAALRGAGIADAEQESRNNPHH
jgi:hypothetical protein